MRNDAQIYIQASIFNTFGAAENLAWIWVIEKAITKEDGSALPNYLVGLRKSNKVVRKSLPQAFQDYLAGMDEWFDALDDFRHPLAHRIPLYIPPFIVTTDNEAAYSALEDHKARASVLGDLEDYNRVDAEQGSLEEFRPWMQHSFIEESKRMVFHPQLLANFNTIEEMGRKLLEALDR